MKICFIVNDLNMKAGTERAVTIVANNLSKAGYDITILSFMDVKKSGYELHKDVKVVDLNVGTTNFKLGYFKVVKNLRNIVKTGKYDFVVEAEVYNRLFSMFALKGLSTKLITWEHFNYFVTLGRKERAFARKLAAKYSDAVVTLTEADRINYEQNEKCVAKIRAIANPVVFKPEEKSKLDNKSVLAIGRLTYQKGFDILLECWKRLKEQDPTNEWILNIVGEGEDREKLEAFIKQNNLEGSIFLKGATSNIKDYYLESSIYAMTSRFEGLPMVLIEALSFGIPIVSMDCQTGPAELITSGENGYLSEMDDTQEFVNNMITIMNDNELRKTMGRNTEQVLGKLDEDVILNKWVDLFKELKG
ncbi:MAG: glycosyltransferase family 4 protein [Clostridium sp.]